LMWPRFVKKVFAPSAVTPRFAAFPVWMSLRPSQLRAAAAESALMIPDAAMLKQRYGELKMPVFIMAGGSDQVVNTERQSMRLHRAIAQSRLDIIPEAGHMVHHIVPERVMEMIDAAADAQAPTMNYAMQDMTTGSQSIRPPL